MTPNRSLAALADLPLQARVGRIAELFSEGVEPEPLPSPAQRRARRKAILRESAGQRFYRLARGLSSLAHPRRLAALPAAAALLARDLTASALPSSTQALARPDGLCGLAKILSPDYLMDAHARGLYLRAHAGLLTLWSPAERAVAAPQDFLRASIREDAFEDADVSLRVTFDRAFDEVVAACARQTGDSAYLAPARLKNAFAQLYDTGFAHSLEVRDHSGALIASAFGVSCGGVFTVEAMFAQDEAALAQGLRVLARQLERWRFALIDFKKADARTRAFGCAAMTREDFRVLVARNLCAGPHGRWRVDADLGALHFPPSRPAANEGYAASSRAA